METFFPPAVFLFVLPLLYVCHRLGWLSSRRGRWTIAALSALVVASSLPYQGLDLDLIKRLSGLLCLGVVLVLLTRIWRVGCGRPPRAYLAALYALAALSFVTYYNFFSFHGLRTYIHLHDLAHYYLGAKYFDELRYTGLYTAMLRAEAEEYDDHFKTLEARDLETNELVDIRVLLRRSHAVKAEFSPSRWQELRRDVRFFRESMGPNFAGIYQDQGFNPPPFWAWVGGTVANLVPAGSYAGILTLSLLDLALLLGIFAAIRWAFGHQATILGFLFFLLVFGAGFGWTGGAFLRFMWLFGFIVGLCCLKKRKPALAGALLAAATVLRIFPVFFALGVAARAAGFVFRHRRLRRFDRRFLLAFAVTGVALAATTVQLRDGLRSWLEFRENSQLYVTSISPNVVGMTALLSYQNRPAKVTREEFVEIRERRNAIYEVQLWILLGASLVGMAWLAQRTAGPTQAAVLGVMPILAGLNLSCYYYVLLLALVLVHRRSPRRLALIFGAESCVYCLLLFESSEGLIFIYRSAMVLILLLLLYVLPEIESRFGPRARQRRRTAAEVG